VIHLPETDRSGQLIKQLLDAGHAVGAYTIVKDEPAQIQTQMQLSQRSDLDAVIFNGGTGIAPRDTTTMRLRACWKNLARFGVVSLAELSRNWFTSDRVCDRSGVYQGKLVFPSRFNQRCPPGYATIDFARTRSPSQPGSNGELGVSPQ